MNQYNPNIHHRRSIRLKGYDYSQAGLYFITICCQYRMHRFGHVDTGKMVLNEYGDIALNEWQKLPDRFANMELDAVQIMPNHIHAIIMLNDVPPEWVVGSGFTPDQNNVQTNMDRQPYIDNLSNNINDGQPNINDNGQPNINFDEQRFSTNDKQRFFNHNAQPQGIAPTVGDIVGAYKSLVTNGCLEIYKSKNLLMGKFWQRNYYENIIRDELSYQRIAAYIINNPTKWSEDKFYI